MKSGHYTLHSLPDSEGFYRRNQMLDILTGIASSIIVIHFLLKQTILANTTPVLTTQNQMI
jgi:hypothetical protein